VPVKSRSKKKPAKEQLELKFDQARIQITAERLSQQYETVKLSRSFLPGQRQVTAAQRAQVAKLFDASAESIIFAKQLLDSKHPKIASVMAARSAIQAFHLGMTLWYPEAGRRLLPMGKHKQYDEGMTALVIPFERTLVELRDVMPAIRTERRKTLGSRLYKEADYMFDPVERAAITWTYGSTADVPSYLMRLDPATAKRQLEEQKRRLEMVVQHEEQRIARTLAEHLGHLAERLSARKLLDGQFEVVHERRTSHYRYLTVVNSDGTRSTVRLSSEEYATRVLQDDKPKVFRDTVVSNIHDVIREGRELLDAVGLGQGELAEAYDAIEQVVGPDMDLAQRLRDEDSLRHRTLSGAQQLIDNLAVLAVPRPAVKRQILREYMQEVTCAAT